MSKAYLCDRCGEQAFAECYGEECPYYRPEYKTRNLTYPAYCSKSLVEELTAKKEKSTKWQ